MTRYVEALTWTGTIMRFLEEQVRERPLLNACSGMTAWGDVTLDRFCPADISGDRGYLPFAGDKFRGRVRRSTLECGL